MVSSPSPPDPYATAAAQTASNKETANYQQSLNMVNQVTPYGTLNYNQTGTSSTGAPTYTATTQLSPQMQALGDSSISNAQGNANLEGTLLKNSSDQLSKPLDLSWGATESNLDALGRKTIDPQFQQAGDQLEQKLYSQGLRPGQAAYDQQMTSFNNNKNAAYNNLYLTGHQTAVNDLSQQYNSPLNALSALRSNTQVSQPGIQAAQTPQTGVQGTNIAGLIEQNYQTQQSASNATMGGLFGLGGSLGAASIMAF